MRNAFSFRTRNILRFDIIPSKISGFVIDHSHTGCVRSSRCVIELFSGAAKALSFQRIDRAPQRYEPGRRAPSTIKKTQHIISPLFRVLAEGTS